jgi:hypothetical protein
VVHACDHGALSPHEKDQSQVLIYTAFLIRINREQEPAGLGRRCRQLKEKRSREKILIVMTSRNAEHCEALIRRRYQEVLAPDARSGLVHEREGPFSSSTPKCISR